MTGPTVLADRGSTLPLILGFFAIALLTVGAAVAVGDSFLRQHDLQAVCDGAAAAAAASGADLARGAHIASARSLQLTGARRAIAAYLARDRQRADVHVHVVLSGDRTRITLTCEQSTTVAFGALFGRAHLHQTAQSSARAALAD